MTIKTPTTPLLFVFKQFTLIPCAQPRFKPELIVFNLLATKKGI